MLKRTFVEIDLAAIRQNLSYIKERVGKEIKIMLPVKADAYGHGLIEISRFVEGSGLVDMLGVASLDEGIELRKGGIQLPILVLGLIIPEQKQVDIIFDYNLSQTVAYPDLAEVISKRAQKWKRKAILHIKIDTGMGRIGCRPEEAVDIIKKISSFDFIEIEGIFSHFPDADGDDPTFTKKQIREFTNIINELKQSGFNIPLKHISNSAGIIDYPESSLNMVRPGIISYGYMPSHNMSCDIPIKPSMTLKSSIIFIKRVAKGIPLSYGLTYTTDRDSYIATIPIGYGDGYSRLLSNKGRVLINKRQYPVVGKVSMDQILVNLGDDHYPPGEEVILFGNREITVDTVARWVGTIPYEITCGISRRVPRIYIN